VTTQLQSWLYYGSVCFQRSMSDCSRRPRPELLDGYRALAFGRHADAEATLAKMKAAWGDATAYQYATLCAQWGDRLKALEWLDTAMRYTSQDAAGAQICDALRPAGNEVWLDGSEVEGRRCLGSLDSRANPRVRRR
jgi:hypothetical protein